MPQSVIVFPERDFTSITGFAPNADLFVQFMRNNVMVSDARGKTDATGFLEVIHPGGACAGTASRPTLARRTWCG